jgi:hypothetical protein
LVAGGCATRPTDGATAAALDNLRRGAILADTRCPRGFLMMTLTGSPSKVALIGAARL